MLLHSLAKGLAQRSVDRAWEQEFERGLASLSAEDASLLEFAMHSASHGALERRLAEIALDQKRFPARHAELTRYRQSEAELAKREGRRVSSQNAVNRPPAVLPEHADVNHRLAWEGLLLGAGWWQTSERAASVLDAMDAGASVVALGAALARAMRGFDPQLDQGWRERSIVELQRILLRHPSREGLLWMALAWEHCPHSATRERLRAAITAERRWAAILTEARADPTLKKGQSEGLAALLAAPPEAKTPPGSP